MTWEPFLKVTSQKPPRPLLVEALSYAKKGRLALDLGAGAMNDTRYLTQNGFSVVAVDSNEDVETYLKDVSNVEFVQSSFDQFAFPVGKFDIVNAEYALPFNPPETFNKVFSNMTVSLNSGGIFVGQFFGKEDGWADKTSMTFHSEIEIKDLLAPYNIIVLREEKHLGQTAAGKEKFWHVFHVIAEKK